MELLMYKFYKILGFLLVLFLVCCSVTWSEGQECGENPMTAVLKVSHTTGRSLKRVLRLLQQIDRTAYDNLEGQFRVYATCVGLVDAGFFKKRSQPEVWHDRDFYEPRTSKRDTDYAPEDLDGEELEKSLFVFDWINQIRKEQTSPKFTDYTDLIQDLLNS